MSYDAVQSGPPNVKNSSYPASGATVATAIDTFTAAEWVSIPSQGWVPVSAAFAKNVALGVTAAQASLLVVTAPVSGLYQVTGVAVQSTSTGTTPGAFQVAYTDADTGTALTATSFNTPAALSAVGTSNVATTTINAKAGTTITVSSLIVGGTGGAVNLKARVAYLG